MAPAPRLDATFTFADFELDWRSRELRNARGEKLRVQHQPLHALWLLVTAGGTVVTREDLRVALWESDTFVDFDRAINKAINRLRQVLGDDHPSPNLPRYCPIADIGFSFRSLGPRLGRREIRTFAKRF